MKKLLLIPLLLFCVTAFGQWTKPQLYSNINTNIRLKTYSPTRLAAMLDSIVVSMGSGGVTDHGALTGLSDDDHTQYHNDARGDARYPLLSGGYVNPSFITSLPWSKITSTPTTIAGYGITDFNSLGDARWWALGGNSTLTSAVTINGSSSNHDITIGDTNEIGTFRVQSIGGIYLSNAVSTYSGAFRLGSNGNVGFDHSYFKIPASGYGVELGNTPIGGGVKLSSGSNAGQLEIGKYTGTNGDNPYVKFDLTVASDATGDTYYRNSSGYFTRLPAGTNGHVLTLSGGIPSWASPSTLSDGDKGDITVNGGGTNWTIDNSTVTLAKMANMATSSLIYRKTAGTGAPEVNTLATLKTDLGLTGTNSGDQTSIVGITGTTSQFNTALSDNDFATLLGSETLSNKTLGGGTWWSSAPTITDGLTITFNPNGTQAGFNFGSHASNPSIGNPGDGYYNSTDNDVMLNDGNWRPAVLTDKVQTLTNKTISPTANTIRYPTRTQSGTSYTIQASDENYIIQFTSASAIAVTLPDGLSTNFNCTLMNYGGGVITVTAATTLNTAGSANTIETQYTGASFQHVGSNVWDGVGALGSAGGGSGDVVGPASSTNNNVVFFDGTTGKLIKDSGLTLSGTNTGDQTTITGNAGTATTLQTARTIGIATGDITSAGSSFNGSANNTNAYTIANDAVTYAKMQNVSAASKLIGRGDSGSGDPQEITIGSGLTMTGTTLSASGGGGISNTAANNELMKSDGTNAIPSGLYSISAGDFYLGNSGLAGSSRNIVADGSASNVELYFQPKGTSPSIFKNGISLGNNAGTSSLLAFADEGAGHGITSVYNSSTSSGSFKIKGADGVASYTITGQKTEVLGGNAYTVGNNNGGDVNIEGGAGNGTGTKGVVTIGNEFVFNHTDKTLNIDVATSTPPTPAANTLSYFARKVGGRAMPAFISPSGLDTYIQSGLARNKIALASPNGNSTTVTSWGIALTATGTATAANVATTNLHTQMKRLDYLVTTAATTAVAGFRSNAAQFWRGNAAGRGGWHMVCRWGPATGVATSTNRAYVGLGSASAPTDVEPSSQTNIAGMGWDAADTNIQFFHNDGSGTATKIDLGASFPVPTSDRTEVYEIAMFCAPNGSEIFYEVTNLATGDVATGSVTTDLIVNTTLVAPRGYMSVGGTSSVIGITLMSLYIETDY